MPPGPPDQPNRNRYVEFDRANVDAVEKRELQVSDQPYGDRSDAHIPYIGSPHDFGVDRLRTGLKILDQGVVVSLWRRCRKTLHGAREKGLLSRALRRVLHRVLEPWRRDWIHDALGRANPNAVAPCRLRLVEGRIRAVGQVAQTRVAIGIELRNTLTDGDVLDLRHLERFEPQA